MATKKPSSTANGKEVVAAKVPARSAIEAEKGIHTGVQFANVMSALMSDVLSGRVMPDVANAACNAGGKLLKVVEMQLKYGGPDGGSALQLTSSKAK